MSGIADDVVELLDGYQHALADAAIVRGGPTPTPRGPRRCVGLTPSGSAWTATCP